MFPLPIIQRRRQPSTQPPQTQQPQPSTQPPQTQQPQSSTQPQPQQPSTQPQPHRKTDSLKSQVSTFYCVGNERQWYEVNKWLETIYKTHHSSCLSKKKNQNNYAQNGCFNETIVTTSKTNVMTKRILVITGPPGIGKTTGTRNLCEKFGYFCCELNASDERTKKVIKSFIVENMYAKTFSKRIALILDEMDGANNSTEDNNVSSSVLNNNNNAMSNMIIDLIKKHHQTTDNSKEHSAASVESINPIIILANDHQNKMIKSLAAYRQYVMHVKMERLKPNELMYLMNNEPELEILCFKCKISTDEPKKRWIVDQANGDARALKNTLRFISFRESNNIASSSNVVNMKHDCEIDMFNMMSYLLKTEIPALSQQQQQQQRQMLKKTKLICADIYLSHDSSIAKLTSHENYPKYMQFCCERAELEKKHKNILQSNYEMMKRTALVAECFSHDEHLDHLFMRDCCVFANNGISSSSSSNNDYDTTDAAGSGNIISQMVNIGTIACSTYMLNGLSNMQSELYSDHMSIASRNRSQSTMLSSSTLMSDAIIFPTFFAYTKKYNERFRSNTFSAIDQKYNPLWVHAAVVQKDTNVVSQIVRDMITMSNIIHQRQGSSNEYILNLFRCWCESYKELSAAAASAASAMPDWLWISKTVRKVLTDESKDQIVISSTASILKQQNKKNRTPHPPPPTQPLTKKRKKATKEE